MSTSIHKTVPAIANCSDWQPRPELKKLFLNLTDCRMPVTLAGQTEMIYFTQTHIDDLRVAIESDKPTPKT